MSAACTPELSFAASFANATAAATPTTPALFGTDVARAELFDKEPLLDYAVPLTKYQLELEGRAQQYRRGKKERQEKEQQRQEQEKEEAAARDRGEEEGAWRVDGRMSRSPSPAHLRVGRSYHSQSSREAGRCSTQPSSRARSMREGMREVSFQGSHARDRFEESVARSTRIRAAPRSTRRGRGAVRAGRHTGRAEHAAAGYDDAEARVGVLETVIDAPVLLTPFEIGMEQGMEEERQRRRRCQEADAEERIMAHERSMAQEAAARGAATASYGVGARSNTRSNAHSNGGALGPRGMPPRSSSKIGSRGRNRDRGSSGAAFDGKDSSRLALATPVAAAVRELTAVAGMRSVPRAIMSPAASTMRHQGITSSSSSNQWADGRMNGRMNGTSTPTGGTDEAGSKSSVKQQYPWGAVNMRKLVEGMIHTTDSPPASNSTPPPWRLGFKNK
jgi:hypothetical protein